MTGDVPENVGSAFGGHDAFEARGTGTHGRPEWYAVTTTRFDARVTAGRPAESTVRYVVSVAVPMLSTAAGDEVGPAVEDGWFETLERRLADATMATRGDVDLEEFLLREEDGMALARFAFELGDPNEAADVAKALVEYVEGTYVEGLVPGYEYDGVVADLLARAARGEGDAGRGPTPL